MRNSCKDCITCFVETLLSTYQNQTYIGYYINQLKKLFQLSKLPAWFCVYILSKNQRKCDVRSGLISLWNLFFETVTEDVIESEIRNMEDYITFLHDKIPEEEWIIDSQDYLYIQYTTPFHIAAWCGDYDFFKLMHTKYPTVWNNYITARDIIGNLPIHSCFMSCDYWENDIKEMLPFSSLTETELTEYNALGLCPLHISCICNQIKGVEQLLSQHVNLTYPVHLCGDENMSCLLENVDQIRDVCKVKFAIKIDHHYDYEWSGSCSVDGSLNTTGLGSDASFDDYHGSLIQSYNIPPPVVQPSTSSDYHYELEQYTALHLALMCDAPQCAYRLLQSLTDLTNTIAISVSPLQVISLHSMAIFSYFTSSQSHELFHILPKLWNHNDNSSNPSQDLLPFTIINGIVSMNYVSVIRILSTQINLSSSCFNHIYAPLHIACILLNETFIRLLLGYGANVQEVAHHNETCLHLIIKSQSKPYSSTIRANLLGLLMMAGCDPSIVDDKGYSPLWYAVRQGDLACVAILLAYGANPTVCQQNVYGRNAFHESLRLHNEDVARLIVKKHPGLLNIPDSQGWYPLHYVINNGNIQLMVYLLNHTTPLNDKAILDMRIALQDNHIAFKHWVAVVAPLIAKQLEKIKPNQNRYHLNFFLPNRTVEKCMQCGRRFSLITTRRHCRRCGQILCANCCQDSTDESLDHICNKCRQFNNKEDWRGHFLQQFEDGIKSYFVKIDSLLLRGKQ